jgi:uncharacterized YccA/Bax inhibitor family protein
MNNATKLTLGIILTIAGILGTLFMISILSMYGTSAANIVMTIIAVFVLCFGTITIRNSRQPQEPPENAGLVIQRLSSAVLITLGVLYTFAMFVLYDGYGRNNAEVQIYYIIHITGGIIAIVAGIVWLYLIKRSK